MLHSKKELDIHIRVHTTENCTSVEHSIYNGSDDSVIDTRNENEKTKNSFEVTGDLLLHSESYYDKICSTSNASNESGHLKR